jgi:hypothetical protein
VETASVLVGAVLAATVLTAAVSMLSKQVMAAGL